MKISRVYDVRFHDDDAVEAEVDGEVFLIGLCPRFLQPMVWLDGLATPWIMEGDVLDALEWVQTGRPCPECDGHGAVEIVRTGIGAPFELDERTCPTCDGEGYQL